MARAGIPSRSLLLTFAVALCALLALASPALAAPPSSVESVLQESQTTTTVDVRAHMRSEKGKPVRFYFEYGTTTSYGASTSEADATFREGYSNASTDGYEARQTIGGLSPGGVYHVRVVAKNADGTSYGPDSTIHTDDVDTDGDGVKDRMDQCPTVSGSGGPRPGCPPPGPPTVQTGPVSVTSEGVKFTATVNSNGSGGFVTFQYSVFEDFDGYIGEFQGWAYCAQKAGYRDANGREQYQYDFPLPPTYDSVEVTCTPAAGSNSDPKLELLTTSGFASKYDKVYVRAIARYSANGQQREVAGNTQVFDPPGGGDGGGTCVVGPDSECGTGGGGAAAALTQALAVSGKAAKIGAILKAGGFLAPFAAPSAGQAAITWFLVPKGARIAAAKPVVVAKGAKRASDAGKVKVKVRLTSKGRALLKRSKKVKLVARGTFTPETGKKVTKKRTITLKR